MLIQFSSNSIKNLAINRNFSKIFRKKFIKPNMCRFDQSLFVIFWSGIIIRSLYNSVFSGYKEKLL